MTSPGRKDKRQSGSNSLFNYFKVLSSPLKKNSVKDSEISEGVLSDQVDNIIDPPHLKTGRRNSVKRKLRVSLKGLKKAPAKKATNPVSSQNLSHTEDVNVRENGRNDMTENEFERDVMDVDNDSNASNASGGSAKMNCRKLRVSKDKDYPENGSEVKRKEEDENDEDMLMERKAKKEEEETAAEENNEADHESDDEEKSVKTKKEEGGEDKDLACDISDKMEEISVEEEEEEADDSADNGEESMDEEDGKEGGNDEEENEEDETDDSSDKEKASMEERDGDEDEEREKTDTEESIEGEDKMEEKEDDDEEEKGENTDEESMEDDEEDGDEEEEGEKTDNEESIEGEDRIEEEDSDEEVEGENTDNEESMEDDEDGDEDEGENTDNEESIKGEDRKEGDDDEEEEDEKSDEESIKGKAKKEEENSEDLNENDNNEEEEEKGESDEESRDEIDILKEKISDENEDKVRKSDGKRKEFEDCKETNQVETEKEEMRQVELKIETQIISSESDAAGPSQKAYTNRRRTRKLPVVEADHEDGRRRSARLQGRRSMLASPVINTLSEVEPRTPKRRRSKVEEKRGKSETREKKGNVSSDKTPMKIAPLFLFGKKKARVIESESEDEVVIIPVVEKTPMSAERAAFMRSGVPEILKIKSVPQCEAHLPPFRCNIHVKNHSSEEQDLVRTLLPVDNPLIKWMRAPDLEDFVPIPQKFELNSTQSMDKADSLQTVLTVRKGHIFIPVVMLSCF